MCDGLFRAVATAARLIDWRRHAGVHPRLGATDVCPLAPIADITLAECAVLARQLGRRIPAKSYSCPSIFTKRPPAAPSGSPCRMCGAAAMRP